MWGKSPLIADDISSTVCVSCYSFSVYSTSQRPFIFSQILRSKSLSYSYPTEWATLYSVWPYQPMCCENLHQLICDVSRSRANSPQSAITMEQERLKCSLHERDNRDNETEASDKNCFL
ncbi:hypothetical protein KQX54_008156 [Cotesia glomerata]|uniref:Uncharacterized protein n=1 Tax=Cotesia glomerata TaxID=32391 RepID=A0AAV7J6B8_COTGL|nr:hypothetical protein KQX54_008156 [Cotesia glomerata]